MENDILEIAKTAQYNSKMEAGAIQDYTEFMKIVLNSGVEENLKTEIISIIEELIADELNHQEKLNALYVELTDIQPNKE